jgi:hypothetical protein
MKTKKTQRAAKSAVAPAPTVEVTAKPASKPTPAKLPPSLEAIRARAYQLYQKSGFKHGHDKEHWYQAERDLSA